MLEMNDEKEMVLIEKKCSKGWFLSQELKDGENFLTNHSTETGV